MGRIDAATKRLGLSEAYRLLRPIRSPICGGTVVTLLWPRRLPQHHSIVSRSVTCMGSL
eukprot:COSAG02_NODE_45902_length_353_cov_0.712598_1_plen_58_part_01